MHSYILLVGSPPRGKAISDVLWCPRTTLYLSPVFSRWPLFLCSQTHTLLEKYKQLAQFLQCSLTVFQASDHLAWQICRVIYSFHSSRSQPTSSDNQILASPAVLNLLYSIYAQPTLTLQGLCTSFVNGSLRLFFLLHVSWRWIDNCVGRGRVTGCVFPYCFLIVFFLSWQYELLNNSASHLHTWSSYLQLHGKHAVSTMKRLLLAIYFRLQS